MSFLYFSEMHLRYNNRPIYRMFGLVDFGWFYYDELQRNPFR